MDWYRAINRSGRIPSVLLLLSHACPAAAFQPKALSGGGYVFFTLTFSAIALFSLAMILFQSYRSLSYSILAVLILLLGTSLDGTLGWALDLTSEHMGTAPLLIGAVTAGFGWWHTALHIESPHPFGRLKKPFLGFAALSLALLPAYLLIETIVPLYSALNTLMLLMIASSVLPPMTWQGLNKLERRVAIAMPMVLVTVVLGVYITHFLGEGFERDVLNGFNRMLAFLYLLFALGFALYYLLKRVRKARLSEHRADIAAREAAESALALSEAQREFEQLEAIARDRSRALAEASHDIRQPIAAMRRAAEQLRQQKGAEGAEQIIHAAEYLDELARSYLADTDLDPSAEGEIERNALGLEVVNVRLLTTAVAQLHELQAKAQKVKLELHDDDYRVEVHPLLLVRVLSNLVANALAHAQATHIVLRVDQQSEHIEIAVEDDGIGIPEEERQRVLDPAHKHQGSEGYGLGLSIVASLADQNNWDFHLEPSALGGVRAALTVPAA